MRIPDVKFEAFGNSVTIKTDENIYNNLYKWTSYLEDRARPKIIYFGKQHIWRQYENQIINDFDIEEIPKTLLFSWLYRNRFRDPFE